jgi:uridine phosphorylase
MAWQLPSHSQAQLLAAGAVGAAGAVAVMLAARALWADAPRPLTTFSSTSTDFTVTPRPGGQPPLKEGLASPTTSSAADSAASTAASPAPAPPLPPAAAPANVNGVPLEGGKTMHLGVGAGDVAQRVLSVGDVGRAERLSAALLGASRHTVTSSRGFVTHTGTFGGLPLTICATLMGFANMDFVVRELRACVPGPMAVLRLGTCGGLQEHVPEGTLVVVSASLCVRRNPDAAAAPAPYAQATALPLHHHGAGEGSSHQPSLAASPAFPYDISGRVAPHAGLSALYAERLGRTLQVVQGLGASADSFYSSQGRASGAWGDRNAAVLPTLERAGVCALEMETCAWAAGQGRKARRARAGRQAGGGTLRPLRTLTL